MNWLSQLRSQTKFDLLTFRRNPAATFFTIILPLIFLVLFASIFGDEELNTNPGLRVANAYVPGILALSIVGSTMINIAITMVTKRERGQLKRVRGTPLQPWVFVASQIAASIAIMLVMTVIVTIVGAVFYDVQLQAGGIPALLISLVVGSASFCAIGLALTTIIPSVDAAPAVTNAISLPLYFISDIFVPPGQVPDWIATLGDIFPVKRLNYALFESFNPFADSTPMPWTQWGVIALWGLAGAAIAVKRFRWSPWGS